MIELLIIFFLVFFVIMLHIWFKYVYEPIIDIPEDFEVTKGDDEIYYVYPKPKQYELN